ncbi:MAG TPA: hypothetical protein VHX65_08690 [Pirellulales bacterium]|jgi:hypothetical protein|nr:hypothetical protein [Pirellulales bacterium]
MKTISGYITIVQEDRFRLAADDGRGLLLTLKHNADVDDDDLQRLCASHRRVHVLYDGEPDYENGLARSVRPVPPDADAPSADSARSPHLLSARQ